MNNNPTYQQPLCSPCATCDESNTTTTRKRDENETRTTASDTVRCVPQLRFPEFQNAGEWKTVELGAIVEYENGVAHEQDIDVNGKYVLVNSKYISSNGQIEKRTDTPRCLAQKGDILMVLSDLPNGRALAKCFYVQENGKYTVNQRICKLRPRGVHSKFLYYLLDRNGYLLSFDDGVKQTNLKKDEVLRCPLIVPKTIEEQGYIADSLDAINSIILSAERTIGQLKSHKNALLQKLFPQRGKTTPELRFPEFQDAREWKLIILKDIGRTFNGLSGKSGGDFGTGEPYVAYKQVFSGTIIKIEDCPLVVIEEGEKQNKLKKGDILVTISSETAQEIGMVNVITEDFKRSVYLNSFCFIFRPHSNCFIPSFAKYLFSSTSYRKQITSIAQGITRYNLSKDNFLKLKMLIPSIEEQQKIADCLQSIDNDIFATTQKLELLQQQKKALLKQLFAK